MVKWNYQDDAKCPRCNEEHEDCAHILKCVGEDASSIWQENLTKLEVKMRELHTHPGLLSGLLSRLNQWRSDQPLLDNDTWDDEVIQTLHEQDQLGWKNMLECLPVKRWKVVQQRYFKQQKLDRSVKRWMTQLMQQLHNLAWHQWDHRNTVLHKTKLPRLNATLELLNDQVTEEYFKGPEELPNHDQQLFVLPLALLIAKPTQYKQSWLRNIHNARQRQQRRLNLAQEAITLSEERSYVLHWMKTGRLR